MGYQPNTADIIANIVQGSTNVEGIIRANSLDQLTAPAAAVGFNSQRITNLGTAAATTDAGPALNALLGATYYEPGTVQNKTTGSTSLVAIDTTNLTVSFTAISTAALVELSCNVGYFSGSGIIFWALFTHGTTTQVGYTIQPYNLSSGAIVIPVPVRIRVTGLTAGTSYQYDWAWGVTAGTALMSILCTTGATSGNTGPAIMRVFAA